MGDDHESASILGPAGLQVVSEPGDGFNIQVVGGLVEHEHVPFLREQGGERYASTLTARERRDGCIPGQIGDQAGDDIADACLRCPFVFGGVAHNCVADGVVVVEDV
ncbi:Uncharacterised protein [Mycobacterium tuberculosis]|nr:Uncharacterised protein [Mycobacterium tuberculosis]